MWGYQPHFRIYAENFAKKIFDLLDENLKPEVFLVGFLSEEKEDSHPICIEPEDGEYEPGYFWNTLTIAEGLEKADKRSSTFVTGPDFVQKDYRDGIKGDALKKATENTLNHYKHVKICYCSFPVLVEGYSVLVILQLDRNALESHYSLMKNEVDNTYVHVSLIDATIQEYLEECSRKLSQPDPGKGFHTFNRDPKEIIREAGKKLMYTPAFAGNNFLGLHSLYESCDVISSLKYEGEENSGKMVIAKQYQSQIEKTKEYHSNLEIVIEFDTPVRIDDYRAVRKLLEMSSAQISLLCDSYEIYGLGNIVGDYNSNREDLFEINFNKHYHWDLLHDNHVLMNVSYGQPNLPKSRISERKFREDIKRIFGGLNNKKIDKLWKIVIEALNEKHGTMVVISAEAESEAERLKNQCTKIDPLELTPELIKIITPIDGAVLIDENAVCYAIGVILDGLASENGAPSRGARYNSAIRYVEYVNFPCMAVVISEDLSIDLIPDLMPVMRRTIMDDMISQLRSVKDPENDFKTYNKAMRWFNEHRFYIDADLCKEINKINQEMEKKMDEKGIARTVYRDFEPNNEINDSYFF